MELNEYVTIETAKLLKCLGFNEEVNCVYTNIDTDMSRQEVYNRNSTLPDNWVSCPTQTCASRWIREKYKFYIHVFAEGRRANLWGVLLEGLVDDEKIIEGYKLKPEYYTFGQRFETYEQAMEEGLKYMLDILIQRFGK